MNVKKTVFMKRCFVCYGKRHIHLGDRLYNGKKRKPEDRDVVCPQCEGLGCVGKRVDNQEWELIAE